MDYSYDRRSTVAASKLTPKQKAALKAPALAHLDVLDAEDEEASKGKIRSLEHKRDTLLDKAEGLDTHKAIGWKRLNDYGRLVDDWQKLTR